MMSNIGNAPGKQSNNVNKLLHSLFHKIEVKTNNAALTVPNNFYPYRAYLEKVLGESPLSAATHVYTDCYTNEEYTLTSGEGHLGRNVALNTERIKQLRDEDNDG